MPEFNFYIQEREGPPSLRRYPIGSHFGHRWNPADQEWTTNCVSRDACIQTKDRIISAEEAEQRFPGSTNAN